MHPRAKTYGKIILMTQVVACILGVLYSCSAENNVKKGDAYYAIGEYYNAAAEYKKAYSRTSTKEKIKRGERAWKMAECYRKINYSAKAMGAYQNAVRYKYADDMALLYLAQMQQRQGDYKNAIKNYDAFLEVDPTNVLAINGKDGCELAPMWKENPTLYTVKKEPTLNSRRADFSPALLGEESDQLYLSSTRTQASGDEISGITGTKSSDIFFTKKDDKGKWVPVEGVEGELNSEYDEGAICFSPDGKTMYLTVCTYDADYPRFAGIYTSQRSDASWSKASPLVISKDTLSSYAHPAVSPDGHWLYFVSDMPGGLGGLDIWRIALTDGSMGGVENVGRPINSEGDEMFPTFRPNGELYFSSNGHPGMGGLDLFCAKLDSTKKEETWTIENLKYPMNSSGDDFGMTFEGMYNRGYFSTSRGDARGWDHIMSFECPEVTYTVTGWVYEKDGYELPEGLVYMVGDDGTYLKLPLKSDGSFTQEVKPGVSYVFLGTCKGYLNHKEELEVDTSEVSQEYTLQFALPTISAPVLVRNVLYEFDRAELTESSTLALDSLVDLLNENPHVTIELSSHCDYRGNDEYNEKLSQRRAESVVNYLIEHGIAADRLSPVGYGEKQPKTITKKLAESYDFLKEGDVLTEQFITALPEEEKQEMCDSLNRRTEFRVLRITYGLFSKKDKIPDEMRKEVEQENPSQDPVVRVPRNAAGNLIQADDVPLAPEILAAKEAAKKAEEAAAAKKNTKKTKKTKEEEKAERTRMIIEEARKDAEAAAKAEAEKSQDKTPTTDAKTADGGNVPAISDAKADSKDKNIKDNAQAKDAKMDSKTDANKANAKKDAKIDSNLDKKTSDAKDSKNTKTNEPKDEKAGQINKNEKAETNASKAKEDKTDKVTKDKDAKDGEKTTETKDNKKTTNNKKSAGSKNVATEEAPKTTTAAEDAKAEEAAAKAKEEAKKAEENSTTKDSKNEQIDKNSKKVKKTKAEKKAEKEAKKKAKAEAKAAKKAEKEAKKKAEAEAKAAKKAAKEGTTNSKETSEESPTDEKSETKTEPQQESKQTQAPSDTKENIESKETFATPKKSAQATKVEKEAEKKAKVEEAKKAEIAKKAEEAKAKEAKKAEEAKAKALKAEEAKQAKSAKEAEKKAKKEEIQKEKEAKKAAKEEAKKIEAKKTKADKKMEKIAKKEEAQKQKILEKMKKEQEKLASEAEENPAQDNKETKEVEKKEEEEKVKENVPAENTQSQETNQPQKKETPIETGTTNLPDANKSNNPEKTDTSSEVKENPTKVPENETKEERIKRIMETAKRDVEAEKSAEKAKEETATETPMDSKAAKKAEKARKAAEAKAAKEAKKKEKAERAAAAKKARLEKRAKANQKSSDSETEEGNQ